MNGHHVPSDAWLDIHGHFFLPLNSEDEERALVDGIRKGCFLVTEAPKFVPEETIKYLDKCGVAMQMLSYLPIQLEKLRAANDFAASVVSRHPRRFGQLLALPTNQPEECLKEIARAVPQNGFTILPDGYALSTVYNGVDLADPSLQPVWTELDRRHASVFVHPNGYAPGTHGRPSPLIEVAFDTARTIVAMVYNKVFLNFPNINFCFAHSGGALPVLSGRLALLGAEPWVPNPSQVTSAEIRSQLESLWFDTAATAETGLHPAAKLAGVEKCVYGADCNVPCSTEATMEINRSAVRSISKELTGSAEQVGWNGWKLFPAAKTRALGQK